MLIETNIDDLNPQVYEYLFERLFHAGALDVWLTPILMKKGRPANLLSVLLPETLLEPIAALIFRESSTIGLRVRPVRRIAAARRICTVETPFGSARVKRSFYRGAATHCSPEYEDCKRLAAAAHLPLKAVQRLVVELAEQQTEEKDKGVTK